MKHYKVIALSVSGRSNRVLNSGDIVPENKFLPGMVGALVQQGFIEFHNDGPDRVLPLPPPTVFPIKRKIKLAIVSAVWKRPEVFELFAKGIHLLTSNTKLNIDFEVIISGSEGERSQRMVEKHGFIYIEMPNDPLATKVNQPVLIAQQLKVDYVLCIGSDDIITPDLMKVYESIMRRGIDYIAVTDFYFFDTKTKKAAYWGGYTEKWRKGHPCGAGRIISSRLMDQWGWKPWEVKDSSVLDNSMQNKLKTTPHTSEIFSLKEKGVYALDIKSTTNMTPFKLWDNTEYIPVDEIKKQFPYICVE